MLLIVSLLSPSNFSVYITLLSSLSLSSPLSSLPLPFSPFPPSLSPSSPSLLSTMLVVDAQQRSSLETVVDHPWLREGQWEDTVPLPSITKIEEIPPEDTEYILHRMELGGYGTQEHILR